MRHSHQLLQPEQPPFDTTTAPPPRTSQPTGWKSSPSVGATKLCPHQQEMKRGAVWRMQRGQQNEDCSRHTDHDMSLMRLRDSKASKAIPDHMIWCDIGWRGEE
jgi:hypothetical protein